MDISTKTMYNIVGNINQSQKGEAKMKRLLTLTLTAAMCLTAFVFHASAKEFKFTDVAESAWFYNDVKYAVESGIINGKTETEYKPDDNLTYAEAIKLAACMNQLHNQGAVSFKNADPWYQPYVDYCKENGIIDKDYEYDSPATRAGYMEVFARALPDSSLEEINSVRDDAIPDVPSSEEYALGIYKLYRAGILQGVDDKFNCAPLANIKRSEVASVIARMMDKTKRITFSVGEEENPTFPLSIKTRPKDKIEVNGGETVTLKVTASGGKKPYTYQWQSAEAANEQQSFTDLSDNDIIAGAKTNDLKIKTKNADQKNLYRCVITDSDGNSKTTTATEVTVVKTKLSVNIKKYEKSVDSKGFVNYDIQISVTGGETPYTYKWRRSPSAFSYDEKLNWEDAKDLAGPEISVSKHQSSSEEVYKCIVTDANGDTVETTNFVVSARG